MPLTLTVVEPKPRIFTITLAGSLDTATHMQLDTKIEQLVTEGAARIITLEMSQLQYISSMGIRSTFRAKKALAKNKGALLMVNLQPTVKKVFEIIDALPSTNIFSTLQELDDYLDRIQSEAGN